MACCHETGDAVGGGRRLVVLNARGTGGDVSPSLDAFLRLVAGEEVSGDPFADLVSAMIDRKVADPKWMEQYMTFEDELEAARRKAEARSCEKGSERGLLDSLRTGCRSTHQIGEVDVPCVHSHTLVNRLPSQQTFHCRKRTVLPLMARRCTSCSATPSQRYPSNPCCDMNASTLDRSLFAQDSRTRAMRQRSR